MSSRPPKPEGTGSNRELSGNLRCSDGSSNLETGPDRRKLFAQAKREDSTGSSIEQSRRSLRQGLNQRQASLTKSERAFLEELSQIGTDEDTLERARGRLMDESIFFSSEEAEIDDGGGWDSMLRLGREHSDGVAPPPAPDGATIIAVPSVIQLGDRAVSVGSEKRQRLLQARKQESKKVFGELWKAHDKGIAMSDNQSRRSFLSRQSTISSFSSLRRAEPILSESVIGSPRQQRRTSTNDTISGMTTSGASLLRRNITLAFGGGKTQPAAPSPARRAVSAGDSGGDALDSSSGSAASGGSSRRFLLRGSNVTRLSNSNRLLNLSSIRSMMMMRSQSPIVVLNSSANRRASRVQMMNDNRSDNCRVVTASRRSQVAPTSNDEASGMSSPKHVKRRSIGDHEMPSRTSLERLQSDVSRKSVTFGDIIPGSLGKPEEEELDYSRYTDYTEDDSASRPERDQRIFKDDDDDYERSESLSNFSLGVPSIHLAHPLRSQSSLGSPPSIHMAHPIRSQSIADSSIGGLSSVVFDQGRDPSEAERDEEEKKDDDDDDDEAGSELQQQVLPSTADSDADVVPEMKSPPPIAGTLKFRRPVLMRAASQTAYQEEGIEVADVLTVQEQRVKDHHDHGVQSARRLDSLISFGDTTAASTTAGLGLSNSFDEAMSYGRISDIFRRTIRRSLSDDALNGIFLGGSRYLLHETSSVRDLVPTESNLSWQLDDEEGLDYHDAWKVIEGEYSNGYGGGGSLDFMILGTSAMDVDSHPHVLSPPLMDSLQAFLPWSQQGNNMWMKYSLVRDGAAMITLLQSIRGATHTFLAVETLDGEVFGSFTCMPWRKNWNYFGTYESFLWRMRQSRRQKSKSIIDQAQIESEIDVFPATGENDQLQLCTHDKLAIGGGTRKSGQRTADDQEVKEHEWGFGLVIQKDLLHGTSSPCVTFNSPSLSKQHADGSVFEIMNMEVWTLTPCISVEEAEKMELSKLFLEASQTHAQ